MLLTDLADACRKSGLKVVELPGWVTNASAGGFDPKGVLCHHTGSFDAIADAASDLQYAMWLAFIGRDLDGNGVKDPPLCNLALSAEGVVYVCSGGNANHAGRAKATGPMPSASDGNALYIGIEAMNSGSQGWGSKGKDAAGNTVTQGQAYARLCAALCEHYGWPASHVRAHRETSVTGKWDPGLLDMDKHRAAVAALMEDDMTPEEMLKTPIPGAGDRYLGVVLAQTWNRSLRIEAALAALAAGISPKVEAAVKAALTDAVIDVDINVNQDGA